VLSNIRIVRLPVAEGTLRHGGSDFVGIRKVWVTAMMSGEAISGVRAKKTRVGGDSMLEKRTSKRIT
jgi:hypothetical protein